MKKVGIKNLEFNIDKFDIKKVLDSVSKYFGIKKVSDSVSEKFGIGKKFRIWLRSDLGFRHTLL